MYLDRHADALANEHVDAETCLLVGKPAESILHAAATEGADLIVLSTHGLGGISRLSFGSVADRLMRESPIPLLVCGPHNRRAEVEHRVVAQQKV
jgi:nucleotide-binding universal stress UspA family protein